MEGEFFRLEETDEGAEERVPLHDKPPVIIEPEILVAGDLLHQFRELIFGFGQQYCGLTAQLSD